MTFGEALTVMRQGGCVARPEWTGRAVFLSPAVALRGPSGMKAPAGKPLVRPCFVMASQDRSVVAPGWSPTAGDMLSDDWTQVKP